MRVPFEWLKEFVDVTVSPEEVADRLTMVGFEVEGMESFKEETILEVSVTPNRPDCLSILGIAREVSVAFELPLKIPPYDMKGKIPRSDFSIEILNPELCNRYAGRVIKNVIISDSPGWIKKRLEECGIRSINNVVDITNYVLLEFGHPLHAFDADTIKGKKIRVATAGPQNNIVTLDGMRRDLPHEALLIWDRERPIAIAGVMGGLDTEVSDKTTNVFLESAYFEPFSIRRTSKRLNLVSESSYRFERGTDIEFLEKALNRAALMIGEIARGTIHDILDAYPVKYAPEPLEVTCDRLNKFLGTGLSKEEIRIMLGKLGIITEDRGDALIVYPPPFRRDIRRESDVAEEIARLYGYDRIPSRIPSSPLSSWHQDKKVINTDRIREGMRKAGFSEVINYSFMSPLSLDTLSIPEKDKRRNSIAIRNPLKQEDSLLRTTLAPSLIKNLKYNLDRGIEDVKLFEISKVFENVGKPLPLEETRLGGIFYREDLSSLWKEDIEGFYITKGALESMFGELKIKEYSFAPTSEPFLHKRKASDISVSGSRIGYLGVLAPEITERIDLKKKRPEVVLFELNLDLLLTFIPDSIIYTPIPKYPSVERDIAIVVDDTLPVSEVRNIIRSFSSVLIEEVSIFDYYKGGNIPEGKKSLAFSIIFRSKERTLTDEEVEALHASLVEHILRKTGGELRG